MTKQASVDGGILSHLPNSGHMTVSSSTKPGGKSLIRVRDLSYHLELLIHKTLIGVEMAWWDLLSGKIRSSVSG